MKIVSSCTCMKVTSRSLSVRITLPVPVMMTSAAWPPGRRSFTQKVRFPP